MFITSGSKYDNICSFSLPIHFEWELYHCISEDVYELAMKIFLDLFYENLYYLDLPEGTEPILRFYVLNVSIKFSVSSLYNMLNVPNEGDYVFFPPSKN